MIAFKTATLAFVFGGAGVGVVGAATNGRLEPARYDAAPRDPYFVDLRVRDIAHSQRHVIRLYWTARIDASPGSDQDGKNERQMSAGIS